MRINIISVGKLSVEFSALCKKYSKMIRWKIKESEITYAKKLPENQIKQFEADLIKKHLSAKSYKIILDVLGKQASSEQFSEFFIKSMAEAKDIDLVIGGAFGLDESILNLADYQLSLSQMTMPHQMVKVVLYEQIYRAQTIIEGHPYHK